MKRILGAGLLLVALFMLLGLFNVESDRSAVVMIATFLVAVAAPASAGAFMFLQHSREVGKLATRKEQLRLQTRQAEILRVARERGGKLTVLEVVEDLSLDPASAEEVLKSLVLQGTADVEVTDSGLIVYAFEDVTRQTEKHRSRNVLDA